MTERWRPGRWQLLLAGLLLAVGAIALLRTRMLADGACTVLRRQLPELTGLEVGIGRCALDPLSQEVLLGGLSFVEPGSDAPVFSVESVRLRMGPMQLLGGVLRLDLVRLERPQLRVDLTRPRAARQEPDPVCPLALFERLELGRAEIRNARVDARLGQDVHLELDGVDLGWKERRGGSELELRAGRGALTLPGSGSPLAIHQAVAQATLNPGEGTLEIARAEVGLDEALLSLSGRIQELCEPSVELEAQLYLPMATLARVSGTALPMSGHTWSRWSLNGPLGSADVRGELNTNGVAVGPYVPGDLNAQLRLVGRTLVVERLDSPSLRGRITLAAELELARGLPIRARASFTDAGFGDILERSGLPGAWVDFAVSGSGELSGPLFPKPQLSGHLELTARDFVLASRAWSAPPKSGKDILRFRRASLSTGVRVVGDRAELRDLQLETGGSHLNGSATLYFARERGLDIRGSAHLALGDFGGIAGLTWKGEGEGTFAVAGPYSRVQIDGTLAMRDFELDDFAIGVVQGRFGYSKGVLSFPGVSGQKGHTLFHGDVALDLGAKASAVNARLAIPSGRVEDVVEILAPLHRGVAAFRKRLTGRAEGGIWIEGPLSSFAGEVRLSLRDTTLVQRRLGDGELKLRFVDGDQMVLEPLVLDGPLGRTSASGTWSMRSGDLDYRFRGEGWRLEELMAEPDAGPDGLSARIALSGRLFGSTKLPRMNAWMQAPNVMLGGRSLGPLLLEAQLEDEDLQIFGRPFRDAHGTMSVTAAGDWPYRARLTFALPELQPLLPQGELTRGLSGRVAGTVEATGPLFEYERSDVEARIGELALAKGDFRARNVGDLQVSWTAGNLQVRPFVLRGQGTELSGRGSLSAQRVDASLEGSLDGRLLESFVPRLERAGGRLEVSVLARGERSAPTIHGMLEWTGGAGALRGMPVAFNELDGRVVFDERTLRLTTFTGKLNGGRVTGSGEVAWTGFTPQQVSLTAELENVAARVSSDLAFRADGRLTLTGPATLPKLGGVLDVKGLRYTRGLELEELLRSVGSARVAVVERELPEEYVALGVRVNLADVQVDNDLARARFGGEVLLTGTNARPALVGMVNLAEGGEAFFRGHRFALSAGQLEFTERNAFDPFVELRAQTQVRHGVGGEEEQYVVRLHAQGRARAPEVSMSSEPGLSEGDIVSLLTLGFTSRSRNDTTNTGIGLLSEALLSVTGLDRQVQRLLPTGLLLKDADVQVSTLYNPSSGTSEPTVQLESRFLTEELSLQIAQPIVSRKGTRAQAEYRFSDSVSAQAQWVDQNTAGTTVGNPGVELKWSWEVE